jgi:hypothetical protein
MSCCMLCQGPQPQYDIRFYDILERRGVGYDWRYCF